MNQNGQNDMIEGKKDSNVESDVAANVRRFLSRYKKQPPPTSDASVTETGDVDPVSPVSGEVHERVQAVDIVDRSELASILRVNVRTLDRMVQRGELPRPCVGAGGRPRWLWNYVSDFLLKHHERLTKQDRRTQQKLE